MKPLMRYHGAKWKLAPWIISGYDNDLYNDMLQGWAKSTRQTAASSQNGSATRNEVLWISLNCEQGQIDLFEVRA